MINSIPTVDNKKNVFGNITIRQLPSDYWLPQNQDTVVINNDKKDNSSKIKIVTPEQARQGNNFKVLGLSIAGATVLTAAALFFLLKGGPKGLSKNFQKFRDYLDKKVQKSKLNNMGDTGLNKAYTYIIKKLDVAQQKFEAVNNFTTLKDVAFKLLMYTTAFGTKIHDDITRMFEKIGRQSVVNSYKKTVGRIAETRAVNAASNKNILARNVYETVEINGVHQTKAQWLSQVEQMNDELLETYEKHFNQNALTGRYLRIKKSVEDLKTHFGSLKAFWSKDMMNSFMAENAIAKDKSAIQNAVKGFRRELSYSVEDLVKDSDDKIIKMSRAISYKDIDKINMLRGLRQDLKKLMKASGSNMQGQNSAALNAKIIGGMDNFRTSVLTSLKNKTMDERVGQELLIGIEELQSSFTNYKQGRVENILNIYKHILSPEEYKVVETSYKDSIKALDKSINIETDEFVSKIRDLALGGAPTDILTILGSLGTLGYHLGKSDDNEQRMSISLKYGIPAIAGIGVSLYCNAKLFAGTKSLIIGSISTVVVNKIGTWADNMLKKYRQKKKEQNPSDQPAVTAKSSPSETVSPQEVVLDLTNPQNLKKIQQDLNKAS